MQRINDQGRTQHYLIHLQQKHYTQSSENITEQIVENSNKP